MASSTASGMDGLEKRTNGGDLSVLVESPRVIQELRSNQTGVGPTWCTVISNCPQKRLDI